MRYAIEQKNGKQLTLERLMKTLEKESKASASVRGADAQSDIEALGPWFHNLHLPDGGQTCPDHWLGDFPSFKWQQLAPSLPPNLSGWSCLDIGCNAGFYSFELARRGATVLGIDVDPHYLRQAGWAPLQSGRPQSGPF